jgi:aspartate ammonia-lyase
MLCKGMSTLKHRCVEGITANRKRCRELVENSIGLVTVLSPILGYELCSDLAKAALAENKGIYELVLEKELLSKDHLNEFLSLEKMVGQPKH